MIPPITDWLISITATIVYVTSLYEGETVIKILQYVEFARIFRV
jgi:hypothetical protein